MESTWQTEQLRLTLFSQDGNPLEKEKDRLWLALGLGPADSTQSQPKLATAQYDKTLKDGGALVLKVQRVRADIFYVMKANSDSNSLGSYVENRSFFSELIRSFFSDAPLHGVKRVAFGTVVFNPHKEPKSALESLQRRIPEVRIPCGEADEFEYKISIPVLSKVEPDLQINRLFQAGLVQQVILNMDPHSGNMGVPVSHNYAEQITLDINNKPKDNFIIRHHKLKDFFSELVSIGDEMIEKGSYAPAK